MQAITPNTPVETLAQEHNASAENDLLTFKEAMAMLHVSRSTIYRLMWANALRGYKVGSKWRFYRRDLQACIQPARKK